MKRPLFRLFDYLIILLSILLIIALSVKIYSADTGKPMVKIEGENDVWLYPLDEDRHIEVEGPEGITIVEIKEGTVTISDSPCEDKLCVLMGEISTPGRWVACMPNRVFVSIEEEGFDEEIDILSY